jgi:hypothetical protein
LTTATRCSLAPYSSISSPASSSVFAHDAGLRLGLVAVGEQAVLHLGHGVHGVDERDAPAFLGQPADLAGQPVVGVDDVVVAGLVHGLGAQHLRQEGAHLAGQVGPVHLLVRPRGQVAHQDAGRQFGDRGEVSCGGPGEDVHLDTQVSEPLG